MHYFENANTHTHRGSGNITNAMVVVTSVTATDKALMGHRLGVMSLLLLLLGT